MLGRFMGLRENIERVRLAAGFRNAADFAREIGVSPGTLGDWEAGRYTKLRLDNLLRIAKGAKCRIEDLVVGVDDSYDGLWRDLADHGDAKPSGAAQSHPQQGGQIEPAPSTAQARDLAKEFRHLSELADALRSSIQDVAHRFAGDVPGTSDARATGTDQRRAANHVRGNREDA